MTGATPVLCENIQKRRMKRNERKVEEVPKHIADEIKHDVIVSTRTESSGGR